MMTRHLAVVTMAALAVACGAACAQLGPMDSPPASAPASRPSKPVVIVQPTIDKAAHQISLPAAFWNEHLTSWVEVGLCGRPSDFLHETIVSITTTKTILMKSLREAGFRDADAWVANVQDFPRIRGDRALVLLEITREGKSEIFPLDELLVYQGWNVSIGPYGWMFKGDPERGPAATAPAVEGKDEEGKALSPREQILRDDPQIALQFKGLQHLSRSFMDHPLCYDDWLYPNSRYFRNYTVQPRVLTVPPLDDKAEPAPAGETPEARKARTLAVFWRKIYDSNGDVDVKLTIRKVSDEEFLKACAEYWHDPAFVAYLDQKVNGKSALETARVLDYHKDLLWKTLPLLRKKIADAKVVDPEQPLNESREFRSVAMWAAKIEAGYATLDAAWTNWACDHAKFEGSSPEQMAELKAQAKLWQEHMELKRRRAWFLARAEDWSIPWSMDTAPSERTWQGMQMEARSEALLAETS